jgi:hypothetical protein
VCCRCEGRVPGLLMSGGAREARGRGRTMEAEQNLDARPKQRGAGQRAWRQMKQRTEWAPVHGEDGKDERRQPEVRGRAPGRQTRQDQLAGNPGDGACPWLQLVSEMNLGHSRTDGCD